MIKNFLLWFSNLKEVFLFLSYLTGAGGTASWSLAGACAAFSATASTAGVVGVSACSAAGVAAGDPSVTCGDSTDTGNSAEADWLASVHLYHSHYSIINQLFIRLFFLWYTYKMKILCTRYYWREIKSNF